MLAFAIRRFGQSIFVLVVMSFLVFAGVYAIGNPVELLINPQADELERARATAALGLDKPLLEQYGIFLARAFSGDLGRYDERGPAWYWNNISCGEHTGTHFDAPIHWISGRDRPNNSVDTLPVEHFIAPACVIDCSAEAALLQEGGASRCRPAEAGLPWRCRSMACRLPIGISLLRPRPPLHRQSPQFRLSRSHRRLL